MPRIKTDQIPYVKQINELYPGRLMITQKEVAQLLGVHYKTIEKYIKEGYLPAQELGRGTYRKHLVPVIALAKWCAEAGA